MPIKFSSFQQPSQKQKCDFKTSDVQKQLFHFPKIYFIPSFLSLCSTLPPSLLPFFPPSFFISILPPFFPPSLRPYFSTATSIPPPHCSAGKRVRYPAVTAGNCGGGWRETAAAARPRRQAGQQDTALLLDMNDWTAAPHRNMSPHPGLVSLQAVAELHCWPGLQPQINSLKWPSTDGVLHHWRCIPNNSTKFLMRHKVRW